MKTCKGSCGLQLPATWFSKNITKSDGLDNYCRSCRKEYNRNYYLTTKDIHNPARALTRDARRESLRQQLRAFMADKKCMDCGVSDLVVLEFDHRVNKTDNISSMLQRMLSWETILGEIRKCDIVCANCHRRRTARTQRWHKDR